MLVAVEPRLRSLMAQRSLQLQEAVVAVVTMWDHRVVQVVARLLRLLETGWGPQAVGPRRQVPERDGLVGLVVEASAPPVSGVRLISMVD